MVGVEAEGSGSKPASGRSPFCKMKTPALGHPASLVCYWQVHSHKCCCDIPSFSFLSISVWRKPSRFPLPSSMHGYLHSLRPSTRVPGRLSSPRRRWENSWNPFFHRHVYICSGQRIKQTLTGMTSIFCIILWMNGVCPLFWLQILLIKLFAVSSIAFQDRQSIRYLSNSRFHRCPVPSNNGAFFSHTLATETFVVGRVPAFYMYM